MTPQEAHDCLTAVQIAVGSEKILLGWARRLSAESRRKIVFRLTVQGNQRALDMWQEACGLVDNH